MNNCKNRRFHLRNVWSRKKGRKWLRDLSLVWVHWYSFYCEFDDVTVSSNYYRYLQVGQTTEFFKNLFICLICNCIGNCIGGQSPRQYIEPCQRIAMMCTLLDWSELLSTSPTLSQLALQMFFLNLQLNVIIIYSIFQPSTFRKHKLYILITKFIV